MKKANTSFVGPEIAGKTLGAVGLGATGILVANAAEALGMKVMGYDPFLSVEGAWGLYQQYTTCTYFRRNLCKLRLHFFTCTADT